VFRKAAASAITLGSGASLGPEAPSVELGANTAAVIAPQYLNKRRKRMLIAAGAAAGVSAAFDAPVAGALFAVEFVLKSSRLGLDRLSTSTVFVSTSVAAGKRLGLDRLITSMVHVSMGVAGVECLGCASMVFVLWSRRVRGCGVLA
jgi:H+/Cl- antiporter ClcA